MAGGSIKWEVENFINGKKREEKTPLKQTYRVTRTLWNSGIPSALDLFIKQNNSSFFSSFFSSSTSSCVFLAV